MATGAAAADAHGYRSIEGDRENGSGQAQGSGQQEGSGHYEHSEQTRVGAMARGAARGAAAAAIGARDVMTKLWEAPTPEVNLYTDPLHPTAQLTAGDRVQLVLESCRPWNEFWDKSCITIPPAQEVKLRVGHNVEIFLYNYLVMGLVLLAVVAILHPLNALVLAALVIATLLMYVVFPEDYHISDSFSVTPLIKHCLLAILLVLALTVGHLLSFLLLFLLLFVPLVLIHALLREHAVSPM